VFPNPVTSGLNHLAKVGVAGSNPVVRSRQMRVSVDPRDSAGDSSGHTPGQEKGLRVSCNQQCVL
jgi:hypothetical protein